jgi:hypothetical protein
MYTQKTNIDRLAESVQRYKNYLGDLSDDKLREQIEYFKDPAALRSVLLLEDGTTLEGTEALKQLQQALEKRRTSYLEEVFSGSQAAKIKAINDELARAQKYLTDPGITGEQISQLQERIKQLTSELKRLKGAASSTDMDEMAAKWKEAWADVWQQFQAEQSNDPFALINLEEEKKKLDALEHYVEGIDPLSENAAVLRQVAEYYGAKRAEIAKQLKEKEEQLERDLSKTRLDNLEYEFNKALDDLNVLEAQRVAAAAGSEEEITAIREKHAAMRQTLEDNYESDKTKTRLEEARQGVVDWQQSLADTLALALLDIEGFNGAAAAILGDLGAQFLALIPPAAIAPLEEFGRALAEGEGAAKAMGQALAEQAQQILRQLPMMFLQAGLRLIFNDQIPLGLALIAAAGSSAIISGYVDGTISKAKKDADAAAKENAKGGVYDEYGRAAREYAAGGAFTNRIVSRPTYFRYGGGLGLMGEAGPEAVMPLTRGSDGRLGVSAIGAASGGAAVYVIIQNYTNEEVRTEESADGAGNQIRKIIIGAVKQSIASGEMDQSMSGRYGLRARGV